MMRVTVEQALSEFLRGTPTHGTNLFFTMFSGPHGGELVFAFATDEEKSAYDSAMLANNPHDVPEGFRKDASVEGIEYDLTRIAEVSTWEVPDKGEHHWVVVFPAAFSTIERVIFLKHELARYETQTGNEVVVDIPDTESRQRWLDA